MKEEILMNDFSKKENRVAFGERLKELRLFFNYTQSQIADMLGVAPATIISYEKKQKSPSIDLVSKIADKFNISIDWLCGFTDTMTRIYPMTYADVLKKIIEILEIQTSVSMEMNFIDKKISCEANAIFFGNEKLNTFIGDYKKTKQLYIDKILDKELFDMWLERELKKYDGVNNRIAKTDSNKISLTPHSNPEDSDYWGSPAELDENDNG